MIDKKNIPKHVAIIMDGNRTWAKSKGMAPMVGHKYGEEALGKIAEACRKLGVKILTVYAFSIENWKRSEEEVSYLMKLLEQLLKKRTADLKKNGIKLNVVGRIEMLSGKYGKLKEMIDKKMEETKDCKNGILNIALNYGGRAEIVDAVKKISAAKISPEKIDESVFEKHLYTAGQPDPDLIIRTSGQQRLSGFLPWQAVYSELYFLPKCWPDFTEKDLEEAIEEYQRRQRKFGK